MESVALEFLKIFGARYDLFFHFEVEHLSTICKFFEIQNQGGAWLSVALPATWARADAATGLRL
jgi:hypothetical protein